MTTNTINTIKETVLGITPDDTQTYSITQNSFENIMIYDFRFPINIVGETCNGDTIYEATLITIWRQTLVVRWSENSTDGNRITAQIKKVNGDVKWYYSKTARLMARTIAQCMEGHLFVGYGDYLVWDSKEYRPVMITCGLDDARKVKESLNSSNIDIIDFDGTYVKSDDDKTTTNTKEEEPMETNTFTLLNGTTYTMNPQTNRYAKTANGKTTRIGKAEYEAAKAEYDQAQLDSQPSKVEVNQDLYVPAVIDENGCVDCRECNVKDCVHRNCTGRNPRSEGGLGECPRLDVKPQQEEPDEVQDPELEQIMEETGLEASDAELERNIRNEQKKPRKARKSKDIAYEGHGKTLTVKQVDFIRHLSDSCFWENGLESTLWIDVLCDEIGGQFAGKPMTVGAMISTLCEKGLGYRATDSLTDMTTGRSRKATYFALTDLGKKIAETLGLK